MNHLYVIVSFTIVSTFSLLSSSKNMEMGLIFSIFNFVQHLLKYEILYKNDEER